LNQSGNLSSSVVDFCRGTGASFSVAMVTQGRLANLYMRMFRQRMINLRLYDPQPGL
jgi:hypothetical protein